MDGSTVVPLDEWTRTRGTAGWVGTDGSTVVVQDEWLGTRWDCGTGGREIGWTETLSRCDQHDDWLGCESGIKMLLLLDGKQYDRRLHCERKM